MTAYCFLRQRSSRFRDKIGVNEPALVDQMGMPGRFSWNLTLSRSAFGFACSDVALRIGAEMLALFSRLGAMVFDPVQEHLPIEE